MLALSVLVALACAAPAQPAADSERLREAVSLFEQLDYEAAAKAFGSLLAEHPASTTAAKAHLYLGLIAFDAFHPDEARREFFNALRANAAVELPRLVSPKIRLAFEEARQTLAAQVESEVPPAAPRRLAVVNQAPSSELVSAPPEVTVKRSHSHVLSWVLMGGATVAAGLAIYGSIEVSNDISLVNSANANPGSVRSGSLIQAQSNASPWAAGWIVCSVIAAAAGTAAVLTW